MSENDSEINELNDHMAQLKAMLYGYMNGLSPESRRDIEQAILDVMKRVEPLGDHAGLALNIALVESRGNGFESTAVTS